MIVGWVYYGFKKLDICNRMTCGIMTIYGTIWNGKKSFYSWSQSFMKHVKEHVDAEIPNVSSDSDDRLGETLRTSTLAISMFDFTYIAFLSSTINT